MKPHGNHSVVFLMAPGCKKEELSIHMVSSEDYNREFWHSFTKTAVLWHCFWAKKYQIR